MLKIVIVFMLITLIGVPMNTATYDNKSINDTLLNKSSLNDTPQNNLSIDISLFNWFTKATKPNNALDLKLALDDIKHDYLKNAIDSYTAEKSITEEDFSKLAIPPAIKQELEKYPRNFNYGKPKPGKPEPIDPTYDPEDEWDPWLREWPKGADREKAYDDINDEDMVYIEDITYITY